MLLLVACGDGSTDPGSQGVGPEGGTLTFADGNVVLEVPRGATERQTIVTVGVARMAPASALLLPSSVYDIGPTDLRFSIPVTLRIRYDLDQLPSGTATTELGLVAVADDQWAWINPSQTDPAAPQISGAVFGAGTYGVHAAIVASVGLRPEGASLAIGETVRFTATPRDALRRSLPSRRVIWSSSDPAVAPVDSAGRVIGLAVGTATISAVSDTAKASVDVGVQVGSGTALGFLGYADPDAQLTVCGTCHAERQATWELTGHTRAWQVLLAVGEAQSGCEQGCHRLSGRGNRLAVSNATTGVRFQDVQCEACHGPGARHADNPTVVFPLASIAVGSQLTAGCGECHTGADQPYLELWERSGHGTVPHQAEIVASGDPSCLPCHEGKAAIRETFGKISNYQEINDGSPQPIVCAVCHNPMGSPNENNARAPLEGGMEHLCLQCHANRGAPPSPNGPHAAQGLLLLGRNVGWIPPGYQAAFDSLTSQAETSHRRLNPRLCITCHMPRFTVTDPATGERLYKAVGHSFEAIPCLDAQGIPTTGPCEMEERYFAACSTPICHGTGEFARDYDFAPRRAKTNAALDVLWVDTDGDRVIDATDGGLLPQVVALGDASQLDPRDAVVTVPEGALWNAQIAHTDDRPQFADGEVFGIRFTASPTSGNGVHNPFYLELLLEVTIKVLQEYLDANQG